MSAGAAEPTREAVAGVVHVVDDDDSVRRAVGRLCRTAGWTVHTHGSAADFLDAPHDDDAASCVILDLQMPGLDGMALQDELRRRGLVVPVVFLTGHGDIPTSVQAMKGGAADFLTKPVVPDALLDAVAQALERDAASRRDGAELRDFRAALAGLTAREREVMDLVVEGLANKQVAARLGIALDTVKIHRGRVMAKTGAGSLAELARLAERHRQEPAAGSATG